MSIKKIIAGVLAFSLVFGSVSYYNSIISIRGITSNAEENTDYTEGTYESLSYKKYSDHIEISDCDTSVTEVVIPDKIEGLPVTLIGDKAFYGCQALDVTIPDGVESIGQMAFYRCYLLHSITIPESVCSIGNSAFSFCSSLGSITIPEKVTVIENWLFENCERLKQVNLPDSIVSIKDFAFYKCSSLNTITIPENVISIGNETFEFCSGLTEIIIPEKVESIGWNAFYDCSNLKSLWLNNPNTSIFESEGTIVAKTIYGYENSTAHKYAETYKKSFVSLGVSSIPITTTATTTTSLITTTTTTPTTPLITTTTTTTATTMATTYKKVTWATTAKTTTTKPKAPVILPKTMSIRVNDNKELTILNCSNPEELEWISSNDEVATVENGKIIGLSKGTATIYAVKGDLYGEVLVEVNEEISSGEETLKGDINGDGVIDASDSSAILAYYAYKSSGGELSLDAFMNLE